MELQRVEGRILCGRVVGPSGAAESGYLCAQAKLFYVAKECQVLGIRRIGPTPFDIMHTQRVQPAGDQQLVLPGEGYSLSLGAYRAGSNRKLLQNHP